MEAEFKRLLEADFSLDSKKNVEHVATTSCLQMFYEIGVYKNFAKFKGKRLCWSLFVKNAGLRPATLLKRDFNPGVFL